MIHVEDQGPVTIIRMARALLGRPIYWTAAYWLDGLLIDTGPRCTARQLVRVLEPLRIETIVLTHGHEDHSGGLALLRRRYPHAKVYAFRRTLPLLEQPQRLKMQLYRRLIWGKPLPVDRVMSLDAVDNRLDTPDFSLRVVETPGHSNDHITLFEPRHRWAFCGDAFIGGQDRAWSREVDLFGVLASLRTLANLRPERLFSGSGSVRRTPLPELHEKIGYLTRLAHEVARLEALGMNVAETVACLFQEEPPIRTWTLGHFSAANLVEACRSYNAIFLPEHGTPSAGARAADAGMIADDDGSSSSSTSRSSGRGDVVR